VIAGCAEVIAISHEDDTHAKFPSGFDCLLHPVRAHYGSQAISTVHNPERATVACYDANTWLRIDNARHESASVNGQSHNSMRADALKVSLDQTFCDDASVLIGHVKRPKCLHSEAD